MGVVGAVLNMRSLEIALDLYETAEYKLRGREGVREGWMPAKLVSL